MKEIINKFINSIDNTLYNKIRGSKSDAECRRYLKQYLESLTTPDVVEQSEQLVCQCEEPVFVADEIDEITVCLKCENVKAN